MREQRSGLHGTFGTQRDVPLISENGAFLPSFYETLCGQPLHANSGKPVAVSGRSVEPHR